jgi:hypothetical protein
MVNEGRFMPMPKTCTIQTPNFRGRYHKQYLADPVTVACEYSISKGSNAEGTLQILSGWLVVPTNTDITTESIITIDGIQTTVKPGEGSIKLINEYRHQVIVGKKILVGA